MEGEGYIGLVENRPILSVDMTDKDVLDKLALFWGTKVQTLPKPKIPNYKQKYRVKLGDTRAASWLMTLYVLMGSRRQTRIRDVLSYWSIIKHKNPKLCSQ